MIHAIIQARLNSRRLPGKVLLPLGGKLVLENVVDRVSRSRYISDIVIATTTQPGDDAIAKLCEEKGWKCFRGQEDDVLDRVYQAAKTYRVKHICRITADCPLLDSALVSAVARRYMKGGYDYVAVNRPIETASYPDGLDTEIFSFRVLEQAWKEARLPSEREHVTPYIWKHPELFRLYSFSHKPNLFSYRLTLDEPADYKVLQLIYEHVRPLTMSNILHFLDTNKTVRNLTSNIPRDEGYYQAISIENHGTKN